MLPSILFGPMYGTIVAALADLLSYFIKPSGPYIPLLTLSAALGGLLRGLVWKFLINKKYNEFISLIITILFTGLIITTINTVILRYTIFEAWKLIPFVVVWIPRIIEEIVMDIIKANIMFLLIKIFKKQNQLKNFIE